MTQIWAPSLGGWVSGDVLTQVDLGGGSDGALDYGETDSAISGATTNTAASTGGSGGAATSLSGAAGVRSTGGSSVKTSTLSVKKPDAPTLGTLPTATLPNLTLPTFTMPERDEARQRFLSDRASRAATAKLSQALNKALVQSQGIENPVARGENVRRSMEGYGTGLADVLASGRAAGASEYRAERAEELDESKTNYQAGVNQAQANWQTATAQAQANNAAQVQQILANFNVETQTYLKNLSDYLSQPLGQRSGAEVVQATPVAQRPTWSSGAVGFQELVRKNAGMM